MCCLECHAEEDDRATIVQLVRDLGHDDFKRREAATVALKERGLVALPLLREAAIDRGDLERRIRAVEVLAEMLQSKDLTTSVDAQEAMRAIFLSNNYSVAERASAFLAAIPPQVRLDIKQLGGSFNLKGDVLTLDSNWKGTATDLIELRWLMDLRVVRMRKFDDVDACLQQLRYAPWIEEVGLFDSPIGLKGAEALPKLKGLKVAHIVRSNADDAMMVHLKNCQSLEWIDVAGSNVSDKSLPIFVSMPNLGGLDLRDSEVSEAAAKQVAEKHPKIKVLFTRLEAER